MTVPAFQSSSLRLRLILLVAGTMLPLILISVAVVLRSYQDAQAAASDRLLQTTRGASASVDRELDNLVAGLQVLALSPALQTGDFAAFQGEAVRFATRFSPGGAGIVVSDLAGQELINTNVAADAPLPRRANIGTAAAVFASGKAQVSDVFMGALLKRPIFTVEVPVLRDGRVIYVVALNPPRAIFFALLDQLGLPRDWIVSVIDRNDNHVARRPALAGDGITAPADSLRAEVTKRPEGVARTMSLEGTPLLTGFTRSAQYGWVVAIGIPLQSLDRPARQSFFLTLGAGILLVLFGFAFAGRLAAQLLRAESDRELLINELNHRVKNTLSAVQAIVSRVLRTASGPEARDAIEGRLLALSNAHNILSSSKWDSAAIRDIIQSLLAPYLDDRGQRVRLRGPDIKLKPQVAITLVLVVVELATNAAKYGALASEAGMVDIAWEHSGDQNGEHSGEHRLRLRWTESGGTPVLPPTRTGYGTQFIQRAIVQELRGSVDISYRPSGLDCRIEFAL